MRKIKVNLSKWFPSNDPLATKMARLCILRGQLAFELQCFHKKIIFLRKCNYGSAYRKTYFFIKMCNTVREINSAIERISSDEGYNNLINKYDKLKKIMSKSKSKLKSCLDLIADIRDDIGSHVLENTVEKALLNMNPERSGYMYLPNNEKDFRPNKIHYQFTGELILCMLIKDTPDNHQIKKLYDIVNALTESIKNFLIPMDQLFSRYAVDRKLY